jgi:hypothetical protein
MTGDQGLRSGEPGDVALQKSLAQLRLFLLLVLCHPRPDAGEDLFRCRLRR